MAAQDEQGGLCPGVCWEAARGRWRARVTVDGRKVDLGCFALYADAVAAVAGSGVRPRAGWRRPLRFGKVRVLRVPAGPLHGPVGLCRCGCGLPASSVRNPWRRRHRGRVAYEVALGGCWLWRLSLNSHGYGRLRMGGEYVRAHRVFFERAHGEIPAGWDVHHRCGVRACVNPAHLEALPRDEHNRITHAA